MESSSSASHCTTVVVRTVNMRKKIGTVEIVKLRKNTGMVKRVRPIDETR
jgi:hypothetical protein